MAAMAIPRGLYQLGEFPHLLDIVNIILAFAVILCLAIPQVVLPGNVYVYIICPVSILLSVLYCGVVILETPSYHIWRLKLPIVVIGSSLVMVILHSITIWLVLSGIIESGYANFWIAIILCIAETAVQGAKFATHFLQWKRESRAPDMTAAEETIAMKDINLAQLNSDKLYSKVQFVKDIPWYLELSKNRKDTPKLIISVVCNDDDRGDLWFCKAKFTFKICNIDDSQSYVFKGERKMTAKTVSICISYNWAKLLDKEIGFNVDGKLNVEVGICVEEVFGIFGKFINYDWSSEGLGTDAILVVEGKEVHVAKSFLVSFSSYFRSMFFGDLRELKRRIDLPEENYEEFTDLLNVIYPHYKRITHDNYQHILRLSQYYDVKVAREKVEHFLMNNRRFTNTMSLLQIADEYCLDMLRDHCLLKFTKLTQFKRMKASSVFQQLSFRTHSAILSRTLELIDADEAL